MHCDVCKHGELLGGDHCAGGGEEYRITDLERTF